MFLRNDSVTTTPPFPSIGSARVAFPNVIGIYEGAKTSCAEYGVTYGFASPPQSSSPRLLPGGGDLRQGLARL